jgi:hypothetical protein
LLQLQVRLKGVMAAGLIKKIIAWVIFTACVSCGAWLLGEYDAKLRDVWSGDCEVLNRTYSLQGCKIKNGKKKYCTQRCSAIWNPVGPVCSNSTFAGACQSGLAQCHVWRDCSGLADEFLATQTLGVALIILPVVVVVVVVLCVFLRNKRVQRVSNKSSQLVEILSDTEKEPENLQKCENPAAASAGTDIA